ncbi:MAG: beta-N-acetylglucosaminidase [Verrucomicrobia bacterium]|nr:beta-N-acetylglucosaminidase [Verrucomicrobiota bacterium]
MMFACNFITPVSFRKIFVFVLCLFLWAGTLSAQSKGRAGTSEHTIIPKPETYVAKRGKFIFHPETLIVYVGKDAKPVARYFAKEIAKATGMKLKTAEKGVGKTTLRLELKKTAKIPSEGYTLDVSTSRIHIVASTPAGLFYGLQTVRQMMPPEIYSRVPVKEKISWSLPCAKITDSPRFAWRGANVDCGRHFFSKEAIMRFIDTISWHKMNRFHWHLTEDQGWRIEIKKYPRLTEVGAWRSNLLIRENPKFVKEDSPHWNKEGQYGGFYSQKDIREIVKYARERFITIVPEIEIPGHSSAALLAYPEFSCDGRSPGALPLGGGVFGKVYCPGKEKTFEFLKQIYTEVIDLFPGEYVHIGGDECPKGAWQKCADCQKRIKDEKLFAGNGHTAEERLQSYTIARIQKFLESKGKKVIGWDEIVEGGIPENCTVMHWREYTDPKIAPRAGHDLIIATRPRCYYNWAYSKEDKPFVLSQGGVMPMKQAWDFDPVPKGLTEKEQKHVLGVQACFWGEKTPNEQVLEFHYFPRLSAMSENAWGNRENRSYEDFLRRVKIQQKRYVFAGVNARPSAEAPLPAGYKVWEKYELPASVKKRGK